MLPIEELVRFGAALADDWTHPVASEAAERWGVGPPRFLRSSASHVFVAGSVDGQPGGRVVLRLRPVDHADVLDRAARAAGEWARAGAPVMASVPSLQGRLVETVGPYAVMALRAAEGPTLAEREEALVDRASDWGEALARLHAVRLGVAVCPEPPATASRPRSPSVYGTLHGDPETDNVVVTDEGLRFVDPDGVRHGWFAADVAFALRDWAPPAGAPDLSAEVPRRFLEGYRRVRPLSDEELSWLPELARETAQAELAALEVSLSKPAAPDWPPWATHLDAKVRDHVAGLRRSLRG